MSERLIRKVFQSCHKHDWGRNVQNKMHRRSSLCQVRSDDGEAELRYSHKSVGLQV